MSKTAQKMHMKSKHTFVIHRPGVGSVPELDYRLHMVYNKNCGNPRMFWVHKKDFNDRFPKIKGDMTPV